MDGDKYEIRYKDECIHLPLKQFELLFELAKHPNQIFSREQSVSYTHLDVYKRQLLGTFDKISKYVMFVVVALFVYIGVGSVYSLPIFHAKTYQNQLQLNKKADFYKDNETISYQSIPVVDRESAIKLGDRKMGQMIDYVSQFEVDESYEQINYQDTPYRVTPLELSLIHI